MKNIPGEGSGPHFDFIFLKHFVNLKPDQGCTLKGEILSPPLPTAQENVWICARHTPGKSCLKTSYAKRKNLERPLFLRFLRSSLLTMHET